MTATARSQTSEKGHANAVRFAVPASASQIDLIKNLGGKPKADLTLGEAHQYIRALKRKATITYHREVRAAREARAERMREATA